MFLYLHSPDHPFTADFCRQTLCSEIVVQFLDANFVSWGAISDRGEGLQMSGILRPPSFPFCAVIAPASGDNIAVLQQVRVSIFTKKFLLFVPLPPKMESKTGLGLLHMPTFFCHSNACNN